MEPSILKTVKKAVNVAPDDPSFDLDIIGYINSEFSILTDLGVGPEAGFVIEDATEEWTDFLDDGGIPENKVMLAKVKTAVILRTRLLFDPPAQVFLLNSMQEQLKEHEWRLNVNRESQKWINPIPDVALVVDGGDPSGEDILG